MEILITLSVLALLFAAVLWLLFGAGHDEVDNNNDDEYKDIDNWGKQ